MKWKEEFLNRKRKLKDLKKMIKQIGATDSLELIREELENTYGYPTRIKNNVGKNSRRIAMYSFDATSKQIQYGRPEKEIGSLIVNGKGDKLYIYICDNKSIDMPDTIEEIYNMALNRRQQHK